MKTILYFISILFIHASCQKNQVEAPSKPSFIHEIPNAPYPWTSTAFELEEEDFTFAIISDLTGGERDGVYSTAVNQLNRLDPTFVLSVGDLIEGGTEDTVQLIKEWNSFDDRTKSLNMPFFHLGGNHDLTNPTMRKIWNKRYGNTYYHFVYENVLFLMLDSEDYGDERMMEVYEARSEAMKIVRGEVEGKFEDTEYASMIESKVGGMSDKQFQYFKNALDKNPDVKWTFVLMHKPVWMREDGLGLGRLEETLKGRNYSVINGHFHSFSYRKRLGQDYTMLGVTGGFQPENDSMSFDHVTLVRMAEKPIVTHLKMEGILDETGKVPVPVIE